MSGKIAIHQPNLLSWCPFFYKMHKADIFVILINCQFEKNGFQNRALVKEKWWTLPVVNGTCDIKDKFYTNGNKLIDVNMPLIIGFAKLLGINTSKIHYDFPAESKGKTERLIEICKRFDCDQYLTNSDAKKKYLDEKLMNENGIEVVDCDVPNQFKKSLFEMFEQNGIEGTIKILNKEFNLKGVK